MGVPDFIENRPKKAAQYGSGVHKILIKKVLKDFDEVAFMKQLRGF
jgi:asparagine synthase (glutamine-hydrolysing)